MSALFFCDIDGVLNVPLDEPIYEERENVPLSMWYYPRIIGRAKIIRDPATFFIPDITRRIEVVRETGDVWRSFNVNCSGELMNKISDLVHSGKVEFRWLTAWMNHAKEEFEPALGLDFPSSVQEWAIKMSDYNQAFKGVALRDLYEAGELRPFIWVDDIANQHWLESRKEDMLPDVKKLLAEIPHLIIKTDSKYGITREHMEQIEQFITVHSS